MEEMYKLIQAHLEEIKSSSLLLDQGAGKVA